MDVPVWFSRGGNHPAPPNAPDRPHKAKLEGMEGRCLSFLKKIPQNCDLWGHWAAEHPLQSSTQHLGGLCWAGEKQGGQQK